MTIPTEHEWFPDADEASDIEMDGVVETPEEEDNEELELRGEVSDTASKYIASDQTEWYSQEIPNAKTPSQNVMRKKGWFYSINTICYNIFYCLCT